MPGGYGSQCGDLPSTLIEMFSFFMATLSSQMIVYPLILDCKVNDMLDTSGDWDNYSTVNTPPIVLEPAKVLLVNGISKLN